MLGWLECWGTRTAYTAAGTKGGGGSLAGASCRSGVVPPLLARCAWWCPSLALLLGCASGSGRVESTAMGESPASAALAAAAAACCRAAAAAAMGTDSWAE